MSQSKKDQDVLINDTMDVQVARDLTAWDRMQCGTVKQVPDKGAYTFKAGLVEVPALDKSSPMQNNKTVEEEVDDFQWIYQRVTKNGNKQIRNEIEHYLSLMA